MAKEDTLEDIAAQKKLEEAKKTVKDMVDELKEEYQQLDRQNMQTHIKGDDKEYIKDIVERLHEVTGYMIKFNSVMESAGYEVISKTMSSVGPHDMSFLRFNYKRADRKGEFWYQMGCETDMDSVELTIFELYKDTVMKIPVTRKRKLDAFEDLENYFTAKLEQDFRRSNPKKSEFSGKDLFDYVNQG